MNRIKFVVKDGRVLSSSNLYSSSAMRFYLDQSNTKATKENDQTPLET